jgi:uncharacterized protein YkwD
MRSSACTAGRRRVLAMVTIVTITVGAGLVQAPSAAAGTGGRQKLLRLLNATRRQHDLPAVDLDTSLSSDASRHTSAMISGDRLFHPPHLEDILRPYPYDVGGAAVGCAGTLSGLHRAWLASSVHRHILMHPGMRKIGIGVSKASGPNMCGPGSFWGTELLYG